MNKKRAEPGTAPPNTKEKTPMYAMKTSSNHSRPQHSSTPAQDLVSVATVLEGLAALPAGERQDRLDRIIATLYGLADEIDGLVRPGSEEA